jgi:glycoside/pentoside/hexuronide:cation symporter, GPH family
MSAHRKPARLPAWALFSALIAMAGLPIYIHAPKFYLDTYGTSLAALGGVLALLRLIDLVQDPALGWLAEATRPARRPMVAGASLIMAAAMWGLFGMPPPIAPLLWFALTLTALFSAFSFLTICFYADGVAMAGQLGPQGHIRLAGWRETGSLLGICLAAVAPVALGALSPQPFALFAGIFLAVAVIATLAMNSEWSIAPAATRNPFALFRPALADPLARRLLLIALLNAAPVAVTSTTFLFFVESRIAAPGLEGPLLLAFFLAAAVSTPFWTKAGGKHGPKPVLMAGMALSIVTFLWAVTLGAGDTVAFAVICLASGAALGADLTLLPALFAARLARIASDTDSAAFSLWSFVSKLSLALAAAILLPALQSAGFNPGQVNPESALLALSLIYAALPCVLKVIALAILWRTPIDKDQNL